MNDDDTPDDGLNVLCVVTDAWGLRVTATGGGAPAAMAGCVQLAREAGAPPPVDRSSPGWTGIPTAYLFDPRRKYPATDL